MEIQYSAAAVEGLISGMNAQATHNIDVIEGMARKLNLLAEGTTGATHTALQDLGEVSRGRQEACVEKVHLLSTKTGNTHADVVSNDGKWAAMLG